MTLTVLKDGADKINLEHISSHFQYLQLFSRLAYRHKRVITFIHLNPFVCPVSINIRRTVVLKYCPHICRVSGKSAHCELVTQLSAEENAGSIPETKPRIVLSRCFPPFQEDVEVRCSEERKCENAV